MNKKTKHKVLQDDEAKEYYKKATKNHVYNFSHTDHEFVGGFWKEKLKNGDDVYVASDFTNGHEVYIEEFSNKAQAVLYASGLLATTKDGVEI